MRCTRHKKDACTNAACIRERAAGAVTGPSLDDYTSPTYQATIDPYDGALAVQVAPGLYVDLTAPDNAPSTPDPAPSYDAAPAPDPTPDTSYSSVGDY